MWGLVTPSFVPSRLTRSCFSVVSVTVPHLRHWMRRWGVKSEMQKFSEFNLQKVFDCSTLFDLNGPCQNSEKIVSPHHLLHFFIFEALCCKGALRGRHACRSHNELPMGNIVGYHKKWKGMVMVEELRRRRVVDKGEAQHCLMRFIPSKKCATSFCLLCFSDDNFEFWVNEITNKFFTK